MPAPRRFLVTSTSMPLAVGWGWNVCVYLGLLSLLLLLMGLLLWMVLKQLKNSVGNGAMQSSRSFREPHFGNCRSVRFWQWKHCEKLDFLKVLEKTISGIITLKGVTQWSENWLKLQDEPLKYVTYYMMPLSWLNYPCYFCWCILNLFHYENKNILALCAYLLFSKQFTCSLSPQRSLIKECEYLYAFWCKIPYFYDICGDYTLYDPVVFHPASAIVQIWQPTATSFLNLFFPPSN